MLFFNQEKFIKKYVIQRSESFFQKDMETYQDELAEKIGGKSVLVIGGGGTIGAAFIKAILPFRPERLTVVDYSENSLTELTRDLRSAYNHLVPKNYITYPFDFGGAIFAKLYHSQKFDIVACFAAHKHVRSEKDHLAIEAMVRNNVFNTKKLLDLALRSQPQHFFSVSTDKAANPVSVMGASKKMMERVLMAYSNDLKISTARFANVAFSNGSLLNGFIYRVLKQQPLSSPWDVKRYFVSPAEAGQLCMLACLMGNSKEIFFPKLREDQMLTFSSIAEAFLGELGLRPQYCETDDDARAAGLLWNSTLKEYPVYFFKTKTSGEKLYEEFYTKEDFIDWNRFEALGVISNKEVPSRKGVEDMLQEFEEMFTRTAINKAIVVDLLKKHLSDFHHIEVGKELDQIL